MLHFRFNISRFWLAVKAPSFTRPLVSRSIVPAPLITFRLVSSVAAIASISFSYAALADIDVYPPNWWVGMETPNLELMLHGDGVANYSASIDSHVTLLDTKRLDSENYLFVTLNTKSAEAGSVVISLTAPDGTSHDVEYALNARNSNSQSRVGFGPKDAIYLIAPDRFANGDESNDSVDGYKDSLNRTNKGGRHGGDIQGIINNLDYIAEMGFTQIWSMPLLENAMDAYSYHGYSTTDYYKIDPRYGTNGQYQELSEKASEKDVGLIMDMVLNHIGSGHPWMEDKPSDDWLNNKGVFVGTTHKRDSLHDPHAIQSDIDAFSDGWFVPSMPDLNQRNPHLANYLIQNAVWWVEFANLSGIRVDTYSYSDKDFLSAWTSRLMQEYPNLNIVGEEWSINPAITAYWQAGSHRHDDYVSALPSVMDFALQNAVAEGLTSKEGWNTGLTSIYETLATDFLYGEPNNLVIFADNHDMSRVYSQVDEDINRWDMTMTFYLTSRGIPQVFYGTEILMSNPNTEDHGIIRSDFPGGWSSDAKNAFTGEGLTDKERWAQSRIKQLLSLRQDYPAVFEGSFKHYAPVDGVYAYTRQANEVSNDTSDIKDKNVKSKSPVILVILNKNDKASTVNMNKYKVVIDGRKNMTRLKDDKIFAANETVTLAPMSASVFIVN